MDDKVTAPGLFSFMPGGTQGGAVEEYVAYSGEPLAAGERAASEETVIDAVKTVYDPEIPVNIYDLGLIYTMAVKQDGSVAIEMSLTAPGCPVAGIMPQQVADAVANVTGIGEVEVQLVWDPPWTPDRMSEDARLALDFW